MSELSAELERTFSAQDLIKPENCLSAIKKRIFVQKTSFESKDEAKTVIADAKSVFPEIKSSYTPSGKTNVISVVGIVVLSPLILSVVIALIFGISYLDSLISNTMSDSYSSRQQMGMIALIFDFVIVCIMVILPIFSYSTISKLFKNRNEKIPSIAAYLITLISSLVVFLPVWNGASIAPINVNLFFIPMKWVFIAIGVLIIPFFSSVAVKLSISNLKFCEETGVFLKNTRTKHIDFNYIENALELLKMKQYSKILNLPEAHSKKHCGRIKLFSHRMANCAFLEIEAFFSGKGGQGNSSFDENATWLVFSEKLSSDTTRNILTT